jgi:YHS domain-containing protein
MIRLATMAVCVMLAGVGTSSAQHTFHQVPAEPTAAPTQQVIAACVQGQKDLAMIAARLKGRLEAARQTNSAPEMRAALDDLQAGLTDIQAALRACEPLQTPVAAPAAVRPKAPEPAPAEAIDPVCGMKVKPGSGPSAEYQGKTYYFCSESDRQRFLKDPATYIKK